VLVAFSASEAPAGLQKMAAFVSYSLVVLVTFVLSSFQPSEILSRAAPMAGTLSAWWGTLFQARWRARG
jgi:hypothetical protein